ncbi:hypothetical protein [Psychrobacter sp. UBA3480]|uniref:hypothetical protein n=1 Tax=Psychrobacter sp. UBA3480 TaxID=1947350 RepID=UPI0025D46CF0|nr:hypothetical protein [Psychrobacter sp. UBA3480]
MQINKLYTGLALASALVLTGCGGDSDGQYVASNGDDGGPIVNNELSYTVFDSFTDVNDGEYKNAWGKLAYRLSNSGLMQTISTIVGSSPTAYQDSVGDVSELEFYAGQNLFIAVPEDFDSQFYKISFVDSDTFKLNIRSGNASVNSTYDIVTLDLEGVGKQPSNAKTGIDTDLSSFPSSVNPVFPNGSQCYIFLETPNQNFYTFSEDEDEGSMTIDEWIANEKTYNTVINLVKENIGIDNELPAARYTDEDGGIVAAVRYNGLIYDAFYNQSGVQENFNTNPDIEEVYCSLYNDVAANFLETQIKANY